MNLVYRVLFVGLGLGCCGFLGLGCSSQPKLALVSGKVTLNRTPLQEGTIVFTKDGEVPKEFPITNGAYEGKVFVGTNKIQFAVYKKTATKASTPGADEPSLLNILPDRYHQLSKETRDVTNSGPNEFSFDLTLDRD